MKLQRKHYLWIGAATVVVAVGAYGLRPKALPVDVAAITAGPLETTVDADGRTRVRERYEVTAPVAGRAQRIEMREGDSVRAGQVLAMIQPLPLDAATLGQLRSRLEAAAALEREASTRVRVTADARVQRNRELSRAERLMEAGGIAPRDLEQAQLASRQADEDARAAAEHERAAQADVRQAEAALMVVAGRGTLAIRAPAAGQVLRIPERSERVVAAGTPLLEIGDPTTLEVVVDVLSSDGATVAPGDPVRLARWSGDQEAPLAGRVRRVEPSGFTKVSALGVDEQRVNVVVDVLDAPCTLGDGFRVDASIITWAAQRVLRVPTSSLVRQGSEWSAWVVRGGRAERRVVRIGHLGTTEAEVVQGLTARDEVIVFPSDKVGPGVRVAAR